MNSFIHISHQQQRSTQPTQKQHTQAKQAAARPKLIM